MAAAPRSPVRIAALLLALAVAAPVAAGSAGVVTAPTAAASSADGTAAGPAPAQPSRDTVARLPSPERPTAFLVTVGPGDAVWERFGHNFLWIHDPHTAADPGYNYGLFSFEQENFVLRFVRGRMDYWMAGLEVADQLAAYRGQRRSIWIQELALGAEEVRDLRSLLRWNERPENRVYRYHYYRDNCSTRLRDALDRVLDGRLRRWADDRRPGGTYRDHTLRLTSDLFPVAAGMHFGLGPSVDDPLTAWQAMFIPMEMQRLLRSFPASGEDGDREGFVRAEWTYYDSGRSPPPEAPPRWITGFLVAGLLLGGLFAALGRRSGRGRGAEGAGALLAAAIPWLLVVGIGGSAVAALWGFTDHVDTRLNLNLFQAGPLHLGVAVLLWPALRGGRRWAARPAIWLAGAIAALAVAGPVLELLSPVEQVNGEFTALLVPANLALTWAVWRTVDSGGHAA